MNRKQRLLLALLLLLVQALPGVAGGNSKENALLWQVSGNGLKKPSYLYGTIHAVCPDKLVMPEALQARLKDTERLTLELDMDDPELMPRMMQHFKLPEGLSLKSMFKEEEYNLLADYFVTNVGVNIMYLDNMKPFLLQTMLLSKLADCSPESYEQELMELAHSQKKEVLGMETVQEQMAAVDNLPNSMYAAMLVRTVSDMPRSKAEYSEMVDLYLKQDLQGLQELMKRDYTEEEYKQFKEVFLVQRNKNWIPIMEQMAKEKATFFAVGAGHLPGSQGLVELLRKQGYKVTPVTIK